MAITRLTAAWSGFRGAPGYSNFYFAGDSGDETTLEQTGETIRSFFNGFREYLPPSVNIQVRGTAEIIDEASGQITSQVDFDPPSSVVGAATGSYSAASGAVVNWNTNAYRNGRRVRGRTFLVPLSTSSYDSGGDLSATALNAIRSGATFLSSGAAPLPFVVWARPVNGSGGTAEPVVSHTVPDLGAILRSRRD